MPNVLGPGYAGKSFLNLFVHIKSVQNFWCPQGTAHAPTICAEQAVCFRVGFVQKDIRFFQSVSIYHGYCVVVNVLSKWNTTKPQSFFFAVAIVFFSPFTTRFFHVVFRVTSGLQLWYWAEWKSNEESVGWWWTLAWDHTPYLRVCVCVHAYSLQWSLCEASGLSLSLGSSGSRGEHAPLSQVGVQSVEDAELLFRLKHHQLLQHLTWIWAPARQQLQMWAQRK